MKTRIPSLPALVLLCTALASFALQAAQPTPRTPSTTASRASVAREVPAPSSGVAAVCLQSVEGPNGPVLLNLQSVAVIRLDTDIVRFFAPNGQQLVATRAYREDGARPVFEQSTQHYRSCLSASN